MTKKAKETFDRLVRQITSSSASRFLKERIGMFSDGADIPCRRWSFLNQFAVSLYGTHDARGIRQWNEAGRKVKKRAKAIYILVPMIYRNAQCLALRGIENFLCDDKFFVEKFETSRLCREVVHPRVSEEEMDDEEVGKALKDFKEMPVFRVEDMEGAPLDYEVKAKKLDVGKLPLIEVADNQESVLAPGLRDPALPLLTATERNESQWERMTQSCSCTNFHTPLTMRCLTETKKPLFARLSPNFPPRFSGSLFGFEVDIPETKAYIEHYAGKGHAAFAVSEALQHVEQIYHYIDRHRDKTKTSVKRTKGKTGRAAKSVDGKLPFRAAPFKERSQVFNSFIQKWVKRNESTGMFCAVKKSGEPWKRVAREKEI